MNKNKKNNFLSHQSIFSFLFFLIPLFIFPNVSQAATNDCANTHTDGAINCTKASNYWQNVYGQKGATFKEIMDLQESTYCSGYPDAECKIKDFIGPWGGWGCSGTTCTSITIKNPDNKSGNIYTALRGPDPPPTPMNYTVTGGPAVQAFSCPPGQTTVTPDSSYGYKICKASNIVTADLGCPYDSYSGPKPSNLTCQDRLKGATQSGDPVNTSSGNKYYVETDWNYDSSWPFNFTRTYNNKLGLWSNNWTYQLTYSDISPVGKMVVITLPNGASWGYKYNTSTLLWDKTNNVDSNVLTLDSSTGKFTYTMDNNSSVEFVPQSGTALAMDNL